MSFRKIFSAEVIKRKTSSLLRRLRGGIPRLPPMPEEIEIETTTACNINPPCVMCSRNWVTAPPVAFMPQELIEKLKPLFPRIKSASLHGIGEPLMQEKLFPLIGQFPPDAKVHFTSNGILLDRTKILELIKHRLAHLNISLDAANPLTYKKIRRNDCFLVIKNNLQLLSAVKKELGVNDPQLWINMTLMNENLAEVADFVRLAKEIGAAVVELHLINRIPVQYRIASGSFHFDYAAQLIDVKSSRFRENLIAAKALADQLSIHIYSSSYEILNVIRPKTQPDYGRKKHRGKYFCLKPWRHVLVYLNGDVWICCHMRGENCVMGNLHGSDFNTIWNNDKITSIRKDIANGIMPSACCGCPVFEK
ncbi:MAG: radical SAM protein [Candidatus Omnitrophica bacterium]|nr:radical SAM protein [Candidatus Omnitrophota bacterium]MDD5671515.1 radical SAM protein [Candidatus Omnitrophota bacterium]